MREKKLPGVLLKYLPTLVIDFNLLNALGEPLATPEKTGGCIGALSFRGRCDCDGICCDECVLNNSDAFINYIQKEGYTRTNKGWIKMSSEISEKCPRILSGDLFKTADGCWYVSLNDTFAYRISCGATIVLIEGVDLIDNVSIEKSVVELYRHDRGCFGKQDLLDVIVKHGTWFMIWARKEERPVVEMTVDEVSDKLGVTVKIVGEKHE